MIKNIPIISFKGTTKIIGLTDSHQETRKECGILSCAYNDAKKHDNVLLLNGGDLFKGIYPRELEAESYVDLKKSSPNLEIAIALGNNDFGFNEDGLEFLKETCEKYERSGINVVCANVFDSKTGDRPDWINPYKIVERDGDRLFVTGFCLDSINNKAVIVQDSKEVLAKLKKDIDREKPDAIIVLNHDWHSKSIELANYAKKIGIKTDLILGGHEHFKKNDDKPPVPDLNIYYPYAFGESYYKFDLEVNKNLNKLKNIQAIDAYELSLATIFENKVRECEESTGLSKSIVPSTLNLVKSYGNPCALGSFLADAMKESAKTDGAFFSTGFLMAPMPYKKDTDITLYDFKKTMIADSEIKKVELDASQIKDVFDNALKKWLDTSTGNGKFLQASSNLSVLGQTDDSGKTFLVKQIVLDGKNLFDRDGKPLHPDKKYSFAIDLFIANGGQGFSTLKEAEKTPILDKSIPMKINEKLMSALIEAPQKFEKGAEYPSYKIVNLENE